MAFLRKGKFHVATFVERENRFVTYVQFGENRLRCHLPNPGRMIFLMIENETELIIELADPGSSRKTDGTVIGIKQGNQVINLDTMLFSQLLPSCIEENTLDIFRSWKVLEKEKTIGNHRFDFILEIDGESVICEVKSTTKVVDGIACFPDAVSKRASSHLRTLNELHKEGTPSMVLFTVYQQAEAFSPCRDIDPEFSKIFDEVKNEITVVVLQIEGVWIDETTISYDITEMIEDIR